MAVQLDDKCVYTIAAPERLLEASRDQLPLLESQPWTSAAEYLNNAHRAGREFPIVFADARDCSRLIAWSVLRSIAIVEKETHYSIGQLWAVPRSRPQDLRLLNSKKNIAAGFIRPYALCETPEFLHAESKKPRRWLQGNAAIREVREGKRRLTSHFRLERNRGIVIALKKQRMQEHNGHLPCEICGFDFLKTYGPVGAAFAEAHHIKSLAGSPKSGSITTLDDFAVVCANCHRMLHRTPDSPSVAALQKRVRNLAKKD